MYVVSPSPYLSHTLEETFKPWFTHMAPTYVTTISEMKDDAAAVIIDEVDLQLFGYPD